MRKVLFGLISVLLIFVLFGCLNNIKSNTILPNLDYVDGDLSNWTKLNEDATNDSLWGTSNEILKVGVTYDDNFVYLAGDFKKSGFNNLIFLLDFSSLTGATNTEKHPWNKKYVFDSGDIDLVVETWGNGFEAWKVSSTGDFATITSFATSAYTGDVSDNGERLVEIAIPLSSLGITSIDNLQIKYVTALTSDFSGGKQWVGDFAPDQDIKPDDPTGGYMPAATITTFYTFPEK
ncbi:hypothetical protein H17ap60334_11136 [Thermosipho africanus H17ap60334]|jgi:hypothetical protein|uniref:hypothetical protein n=1 Tax=Thermosipho africanus TaxID=2421 RepID=UPI00028D9B59|nr:MULTISPECIES: hypothetical protein [Bacteria]EKF48575.1 hypothetical protein H17ap60334_11136 [Thermosipho africanus H17ap60334]MDK2791136.1 hypothetical protein [Methanothermococcus sp.]